MSGEAYLEMDDQCHTLGAEQIYFISGFRLKQQICPEQMERLLDAFRARIALPALSPGPLAAGMRLAAAEAGWPEGSYREICDIFEEPYSGKSRVRADSAPALDCRMQALLLGLISRLLETLDQGPGAGVPAGILAVEESVRFHAETFPGESVAGGNRRPGRDGAELLSPAAFASCSERPRSTSCWPSGSIRPGAC